MKKIKTLIILTVILINSCSNKENDNKQNITNINKLNLETIKSLNSSKVNELEKLEYHLYNNNLFSTKITDARISIYDSTETNTMNHFQQIKLLLRDSFKIKEFNEFDDKLSLINSNGSSNNHSKESFTLFLELLISQTLSLYEDYLRDKIDFVKYNYPIMFKTEELTKDSLKLYFVNNYKLNYIESKIFCNGKLSQEVNTNGENYHTIKLAKKEIKSDSLLLKSRSTNALNHHIYTGEIKIKANE